MKKLHESKLRWMRPLRHLNRLLILRDLERGFSHKKVAQRHEVSVATIGRLVRKKRQEHSLVPAKPGQPQTLSSVQEWILIGMVSELGRSMTTNQLLQLFHRVTRRQMSQSGMRQHLRRLGIRKARALPVIYRITSEEDGELFALWFGRLCRMYADWIKENIRVPWQQSQIIRMAVGYE